MEDKTFEHKAFVIAVDVLVAVVVVRVTFNAINYLGDAITSHREMNKLMSNQKEQRAQQHNNSKKRRGTNPLLFAVYLKGELNEQR